MKQLTLIALIVATSFGFGFAVKGFISEPTISAKPTNLKRATGIGGIFFKCKDPKRLTAWYQKHLGLNTNDYGATFEWYESADTSKKAMTQWTPFKETTKYFEPSASGFMINYRVANLDALVVELRKEGVTIVDTMETYDYGKFIHILDAEGNKVELWEPMD